MIDAMEQVLRHWGEQMQRRCLGGSLASPLAGVIAWRGVPPRTSHGSTLLLSGGSGLDHGAAEVDAVQVELEWVGIALENKAKEGGAPTGLRSQEGEFLSFPRSRVTSVR